MRPDWVAQIAVNQIEPLTPVDPVRVAYYAARLRAGKAVPMIKVRDVPRLAKPFRFRLVDGVHRLAAAKIAGRKMILARIVEAW